MGGGGTITALMATAAGVPPVQQLAPVRRKLVRHVGGHIQPLEIV